MPRVSRLLQHSVLTSTLVLAVIAPSLATAQRSDQDTTELTSVARSLDALTQPFGEVSLSGLSSLSSFLRWRARLTQARTAIAAAESVEAKLQSLPQQISVDLAVVRNTASPRDAMLAACRRLYYGGDPRVFDLTEANCRSLYSAENDWYTPRMHLTDRPVLDSAIARARSRADALDAKLETAEARLDDDLRGKQAYRIALYTAGATSIAILLLLVFARQDVRHLVFRHTQATELVAILLIVMAVIFFGAIRTLNGDSVAGLLGGIAGYVLGRQRDRPPGNGSDSAPAGTSPPTS